MVLVACSGGADSLALAVATSFVAPRLGVRAGLVTVDHGLQPGSAERAEAVAKWAVDTGLAPVEAVAVRVGRDGGPEAAARSARYAALDAAADRTGAVAVLLGHTRDDQAETVLLGLARGAGPRGLAGMPLRRGRYLRPFLRLPRSVPRQACAELDLPPWEDPHNADPAYARARVRNLLPMLVDTLGPGVVANLARTAELIAADTGHLDELAAAALAAAVSVDGSVDAVALADYPAPVRTRAVHAWLRGLGVPGSALSARHVTSVDALITSWHGQGPVQLPGGIRVGRVAGRLTDSME